MTGTKPWSTSRESVPARWRAASAGSAITSKRMSHPARARIETIAQKSRKTWLGAPPQHKVQNAIGYDEAWRVFINVPMI